MSADLKPIPQEWVKKYVDNLVRIAKALPENSDLRAVVAVRAENALDLVKAFRESQERESREENLK